MPNKNLISNIGFGKDATHTDNSNSAYANIPLQQMGEISHPVYILPEIQADSYILEYVFDIAQQLKKHHSIKQRVKRFIKPGRK